MKRRAHAGRMSSGGFSLDAFTNDELRDLHLATYAPEPLPNDAVREIVAIVDAADHDAAARL